MQNMQERISVDHNKSISHTKQICHIEYTKIYKKKKFTSVDDIKQMLKITLIYE